MSIAGLTIKPPLPNRQTWDSRMEMVASLICATLGMGNLWKFPFVCIDNGGLAFFVPYIIVVTFLIRPIFYLELTMGTFTGCCNVMMFEKFGPMWKGIGITQCIFTLIGNSSYAYVMSISLYYMSQSFSKVLPWDVCVERMGSECIPTGNSTMYASPENQKLASAYLYLNKLVMTSFKLGYQATDWKMYLAIFCTWLIVALLISKNIRSSARMAYFIGIFPSMVIFILFLRSTLRHGSLDGIIHFFNPKWGEVFHIDAWVAAINHGIFSFSLGVGCLSLYGSFTEVHTDMRAISVIIILVDLLSNLLCSVSVFCSIGTLAYKLGIKISDIEIHGGMHLAFVTYPIAISYFDKPSYLFAVIFFSMLFMLGIGNLCAGSQVITSSIHEYYPETFSYFHLGLIISLIGFASGIVYCSFFGEVLDELFDFYTNVVGTLIIISAECVCFIFAHGLRNLCWDVEFVVAAQVNLFWRYCWVFVTPVTIVVYAFYMWYIRIENYYQPVQEISAHVIVLLTCLPMFYYVVVEVTKKCKRTTKYELIPKMYWQPRLDQDAQQYRRFLVRKIMKYPAKTYCKEFKEALFKKYY